MTQAEPGPGSIALAVFTAVETGDLELVDAAGHMAEEIDRGALLLATARLGLRLAEELADAYGCSVTDVLAALAGYADALNAIRGQEGS